MTHTTDLIRRQVDKSVSEMDALGDLLRTRLDQKEQASRELSEAQNAIPPLISQMDGLRQEYQEASFTEDRAQLKSVQERRKALQRSIQQAQRLSDRKRSAYERANFDTRSAGLEAYLRATDIKDNARHRLGEISGFLGHVGDLPDSESIRELEAAWLRVRRQYERVPQEPDEERDLAVIEKVRPGTVAEREAQKRSWRRALSPVLARF